MDNNSTERNWTSAPPSSPTKSNKLTHLGALFSFSFSLKYSITFFSQSGLTPFWAERQIYFSKVKLHYTVIDCSGKRHVQDKKLPTAGWLLHQGGPTSCRFSGAKAWLRTPTERGGHPDKAAPQASLVQHTAL